MRKLVRRVNELERRVWLLENPRMFNLTDEVEFASSWYWGIGCEPEEKHWKKAKVAGVEVILNEYYYREYKLFVEGTGIATSLECCIRPISPVTKK